jgi:hypothetical protein
MGKTPITWRAKKQNCVSLSTQEAEYVAMGECAKEILWLTNLLEESDLYPDEKRTPVKLFGDNTSAIKLAGSHMMTGRSKHIDIKHHFIRGLVNDGRICLEHIPGEENIADIFTKPLGPIKHNYFCKKLNLKD